MLPAIAISTLALVGAAVLMLGLRGVRVDDHPLCAGCGFDLHGLGSGAGCPECGAGVGTPGGGAPARIGNRGRVKGAIGAGAVIVAHVAGGAGVVVWAA